MDENNSSPYYKYEYRCSPVFIIQEKSDQIISIIHHVFSGRISSYRGTMAFGNWKPWLLNGVLILAIFVMVTACQGRNLVSEQTLAPSFRLSTLSGPPIAHLLFRVTRGSVP